MFTPVEVTDLPPAERFFAARRRSVPSTVMPRREWGERPRSHGYGNHQLRFRISGDPTSGRWCAFSTCDYTDGAR